MSKINKNNLEYLGTEFQYRLIKACIEDAGFFRDLNGVIDQNMFTETYLRTIVGVMKEYYAKQESVPSYKLIEIEIRQKMTDEDEIQYYTEALDKIQKTTTEGYKEIEDMAERFFFQQNLMKVSNEIKMMAGGGDLAKYEACKKLLEDALSVGRKNDNTSTPFQSIDDDLSPESVVTIPTGIDKLDTSLGGGIDKGKVGLIICPMGCGKALPDDELVVTPNGFVKIKELQVGDYVIGSNGKKTMVTGVFPQGIRDIYNVTFSDGVSVRCDKEHLWTVNTWQQRHKRPMKNGIRKHFIDNSFKTTKTLGELMDLGFRMPKYHNEHQFRIPICSPVEYNEREVKIDPYLLGYLIGDGSFERCTLTVGVNDEQALIEQLNNINVKYKVHHHKNRATSISLYLPFRYDLKEIYGELNLTSGNKYIPENYLINSIDRRIALLNGLMDSDGYCSKNGRSSFSTKSKQLAEDVKQLVLSLGGFASISQKKTNYFNKKYNKIVDCGISYIVSISLCDSNIPIFRLQRKQSLVKYRVMKKTERYFEKAEYVGKQNAICIKVDAEDELFLTKDYIVTHNTSMTTCLAANAARYKCKQNDFEGYKVLQICFEDMPRDLHRKYIANVTGVEARNLNESESTTEAVKKQLRESPDFNLLNNNIQILNLFTGEETATSIKNRIKKKINEGFKPDVVIIDYFECIECEPGYSKSDVTEREGRTMRKFENMAKELDLALWIPTQGNRESISAELVTNDKVGGSIRKNQIAQVVLSITRSVDDVRNKRATLSILKNRTGEAGLTLNGVFFDNGTCTINTEDVIEFDDAFGYNEHVQEVEEKQRTSMIQDARKAYKK